MFALTDGTVGRQGVRRMVDRDGKQTIIQNIAARTCVVWCVCVCVCVCEWGGGGGGGVGSGGGGVSLLEQGPMFALHFILLYVIKHAGVFTIVCKHSHHSVG